MSEITPSHGNPFETVRGEDGRWSARALQRLMGYSKWETFASAIERAMISAQIQGLASDQAFSRRQEEGTGGAPRIDYRLTRHAAYLVAMNGDPRKPEVAAAQAYFVVKTQEAEQALQRSVALNRESSAHLTKSEILLQLVQRMVEQEQEIAAVTATSAVLESKMESIEGKFDEFAVLGYAKLNGYPTDRVTAQKVGKTATRLMRNLGLKPRTRQDATFGEINIYPVKFLEEAFALHGYQG